MKLHLLFIGNKFIHSAPLKEYIFRCIEKKCDNIDTVMYFKEGDNSLFLHLEEKLNGEAKLLIITTKKYFSTIGKLICTVTSDNQVLREGVLVPQKSSLFEEGTYLLEYKKSIINVIEMDEFKKMPSILLHEYDTKAAIHFFEDSEETLQNLLTPIAQTYEVQLHITVMVEGWFKINIVSKRYGYISKFIDSAKKLLPNNIITASNIPLYIIETLSLFDKKLSFAESCTGGLLSYYFTKNNGASQILDGALVTYSDFLKENWLGVSEEVLKKHGVMSKESVSEMSEGVLNVSHADYAISISGIAGDTGGTIEQPVGTVYIGVRYKKEHFEKKLLFYGDRNYIQEQSVLYSIKMLLLLDKKTFF